MIVKHEHLPRGVSTGVHVPGETAPHLRSIITLRSMVVSLSGKVLVSFILTAWSFASTHAGQEGLISTGSGSPTRSWVSHHTLGRCLWLEDTVPDMRDQWCAAECNRFKCEIGNTLKETCTRPYDDGHDVQPQLINKSS